MQRSPEAKPITDLQQKHGFLDTDPQHPEYSLTGAGKNIRFSPHAV